MKKLVFAMMAVFAMVSCGGGAAEKELEIKEDFAKKLEAAVEDKNSEAVVEAYKWLYEEMKAYTEDNKEFVKASEDAEEAVEKAQEKAFDADWLKSSDKKAVMDVLKDIAKLD